MSLSLQLFTWEIRDEMSDSGFASSSVAVFWRSSGVAEQVAKKSQDSAGGIKVVGGESEVNGMLVDNRYLIAWADLQGRR